MKLSDLALGTQIRWLSISLEPERLTSKFPLSWSTSAEREHHYLQSLILFKNDFKYEKALKKILAD